MKFKIVTPERVLLDTEVDSLTLPTSTGEITILPHHIPLVSQLVAGEIHYKSGNEENSFATSGGIIEVKKDNNIVILADTAEFGHEIDIQRAEQAKEAARKLMTESIKDQTTYADASAVFQKNLIRLKVAHKHRTKKQTNIEN